MFDKYARAVADKTERENLHKLYRKENNRFVNELRKAAIAVEREIDESEKQAREKEDDNAQDVADKPDKPAEGEQREEEEQ